MQLRPYQQECISIIESKPPGAYLCQMPTGCGKTATFTHIPRHGRVLVLAHREELVRQPAKYYDCPVGFEIAQERSRGEEVVIASVQSLVNRLEQFHHDTFDMIITDECFPAGTLIDGKPIEGIRVGDFVSSYNHTTKKIEKREVKRIFKNPAPSVMVSVNGVICTPNHPFYDARKERYVEAKDLEPGDCVLHRVRQRACLDEFDKAPAKRIQENRQSVLLPGMFDGVLQKDFFQNDGRNQSEVCFGENEEKEPNEQHRNKAEDVRNPSENRAQTSCSRGKRKRNYDPSEHIAKRVGTSGAESRVRGEDQSAKIQCTSSSFALQDRHCNTSIFSRNRDRRREPLCEKEPDSRRKEICVLEVERVDSIEIYQCSDPVKRKELCSDGYVYNIEVEGNHNYFANGYLVHNCHHAAAGTYQKIYDHFTPTKHIGFTATPNRGDKARLDGVFSEIIFQRDLRWAIESGFLCDIYCMRVNIGYDLSAVHSRNGDYAPGELDKAMDGTADAIAEAYRDYAKGATLIFAVSVNHAEEIAKRIPGAVVVTGKTKDRAEIIERFTRREIPCIVNVMVFTEGTDIPLVETVIIARPTQSDSLYSQMVGRGLRLHPEKERLTLIDCVGVTGKASLCTAPSLLGIDMSNVPMKRADVVEGPIFELPAKAAAAGDCPESWIKNIKIVDLWAKGMNYNLHGVNYFKMPDGRMVVSLLDGKRMTIPCPDQLGKVTLGGEVVTYQTALDRAYKALCEGHADSRYIWDLAQVKKWGSKPASESQLKIINRMFRDFDTEGLTKVQASQILNRVFNRRKS